MKSSPFFVPPPALAAAVARVTGRRAVAWEIRAGAGGYSLALRLIVEFEDGSSAFVKAAVNADTARWIRAEQRIYQTLKGDFLPEYYGGEAGTEDDFATTFLVLEDLRGAQWPPPWTTPKIDAVLAALADVRGCAAALPSALPSVLDALNDFASWHRVAAAPEPFLSLGFCRPSWLDAALPTLIAAETDAPLAGTDLLHLDVRSDNLCFRPNGRAVLVDWNWACAGNGTLDIACWLPSLHAEGGPPPEAFLPDAGGFAALLSGYFAFRAGLQAPTGAPHVRAVQRRQLAVALPWAARALGLPPLF